MLNRLFSLLIIKPGLQLIIILSFIVVLRMIPKLIVKVLTYYRLIVMKKSYVNIYNRVAILENYYLF